VIVQKERDALKAAPDIVAPPGARRKELRV
jgi:hypothetical protein